MSLPPAERVPFRLPVSYEQDAAGHPAGRYRLPIARLRLFAAAREAAGTPRDLIDGATVRDVLAAAAAKYGPEFSALVPSCRVWVNGEAADPGQAVGDEDEVAILPPVSGGS